MVHKSSLVLGAKPFVSFYFDESSDFTSTFKRVRQGLWDLGNLPSHPVHSYRGANPTRKSSAAATATITDVANSDAADTDTSGAASYTQHPARCGQYSHEFYFQSVAANFSVPATLTSVPRASLALQYILPSALSGSQFLFLSFL